MIFAGLFLVGCAANPEPVAKVETTRKEVHLDLPSQGRSPARAVPVVPTAPVAPQLPVYPGAEAMEESNKMVTEGGQTFETKAYRTSDTPQDVARFFRSEGLKFGKLTALPKPQEGFQVVEIDKTDGGKIQIAATKTKNGYTLILVSDRPPKTASSN